MGSAKVLNANKTLKTIQNLTKLGRILSKIVFIFCIVGASLCFVGFVSMSLGVKALSIGGVTFESILKVEADVSVGTVYATMACGMLFCVGEGVLAKFAEHYFKRALADGTPFHLEGARELFRLGILTIVIPLGTQMLAGIVHAVYAQLMPAVAPLNVDGFDSVALGVMFIVLSFVCRYGAEQMSA